MSFEKRLEPLESVDGPWLEIKDYTMKNNPKSPQGESRFMLTTPIVIPTAKIQMVNSRLGRIVISDCLILLASVFFDELFYERTDGSS